MFIVDFGTTSYWIRSVLGSFGHHPHHRNWHQPRQESWSCYHLQRRACMEWPRKKNIFHSFKLTRTPQLLEPKKGELNLTKGFLFVFCCFWTVDLLGWTNDWSCSCCYLPPNNYQSYAIPQVLSYLSLNNGILKDSTVYFCLLFLGGWMFKFLLQCICNVDLFLLLRCSIMCVNYQVMIM